MLVKLQVNEFDYVVGGGDFTEINYKTSNPSPGLEVIDIEMPAPFSVAFSEEGCKFLMKKLNQSCVVVML